MLYPASVPYLIFPTALLFVFIYSEAQSLMHHLVFGICLYRWNVSSAPRIQYPASLRSVRPHAEQKLNLRKTSSLYLCEAPNEVVRSVLSSLKGDKGIFSAGVT